MVAVGASNIVCILRPEFDSNYSYLKTQDGTCVQLEMFKFQNPHHLCSQKNGQ